jgi:hypothetical protein
MNDQTSQRCKPVHWLALHTHLHNPFPSPPDLVPLLPPPFEVIDAGYDWRKVDVEVSKAHADLREVLKKGSYLVDGILNQVWFQGKTECINAEGETGPEVDEKAWRHAVAVKGGFVHEWTGAGIDKFGAKWLWLRDDGVTPDPQKGYMRKILKVYSVSRREEGDRGASGVSVKRRRISSGSVAC